MKSRMLLAGLVASAGLSGCGIKVEGPSSRPAKSEPDSRSTKENDVKETTAQKTDSAVACEFYLLPGSAKPTPQGDFDETLALQSFHGCVGQLHGGGTRAKIDNSKNPMTALVRTPFGKTNSVVATVSMNMNEDGNGNTEATVSTQVEQKDGDEVLIHMTSTSKESLSVLTKSGLNSFGEVALGKRCQIVPACR
ncbi:MAG TPA: hypothetical protein VM432_09170 [Bdellovibrionales bacterium]|nr:hypothetical protein [Bdellovibrionales bacterium]